MSDQQALEEKISVLETKITAIAMNNDPDTQYESMKKCETLQAEQEVYRARLAEIASNLEAVSSGSSMLAKAETSIRVLDVVNGAVKATERVIKKAGWDAPRVQKMHAEKKEIASMLESITAATVAGSVKPVYVAKTVGGREAADRERLEKFKRLQAGVRAAAAGAGHRIPADHAHTTTTGVGVGVGARSEGASASAMLSDTAGAVGRGSQMI